MDEQQYKNIDDFSDEVQLQILKGICAKIYIARNIVPYEDMIIDQLEEIDRLFRDNENYN